MKKQKIAKCLEVNAKDCRATIGLIYQNIMLLHFYFILYKKEEEDNLLKYSHLWVFSANSENTLKPITTTFLEVG